MKREYSPVDFAIHTFDQGLRTLVGLQTATRSNPAKNTEQPELSSEEAKQSAGMMRVNHAGEIAAQGLYHGQALAAKQPELRRHMQQAAQEEGDHLVWCAQRLTELNSRTSYLAPLWYYGSLMIGLLAGVAGEKWSLGFVVETEAQVEQHLSDHLERLPEHDTKSRAIVQQMQMDEVKHGMQAHQQGASELPSPIKVAMSMIAKVMTTTALRI